MFFFFSNKPKAKQNVKRARLQFDTLEDRTVPAVLTVTSLSDTMLTDGSLTLREAISLVDNGGVMKGAHRHKLTKAERADIRGTFGVNDRIVFASGLNNLPNQTLTLKGGALVITKSVLIDASNLNAFTINANNAGRIFTINDNNAGSKINVSIYGSGGSIKPFTLTGGNINGYGGAICNAENLTLYHVNVAGNHASYGGGVYNTGSLLVVGCTIKGNSAGGGGGIYNTNSLAVANTQFTNNTATYGGAIENYSPGSASIDTAGFAGNSATGYDGGGAIYNSGSLYQNAASYDSNSALEGLGGAIHNTGSLSSSGGSLFRQNSASSGGGIYNDRGANLTISNTNFLRNVADPQHGGGGIYNRGVLAIDTNVIFEGNTAKFGAGVFNFEGNASINSAIFNGNVATGFEGGGAIYNGATLLVNNCQLMNNTSVGNGGAIANQNDLTVENSTISFNRADSTGANLGDGGGIESASPLPTYLHGNTFFNNFVGTGAAFSDLAGGPFVNF